MPKILVLDNLSAEGVDVFRKEGFEVDVKPAQKPDELAAIIGNYDGLVVRSGTKVTPEALEKATRMKVIGRAGAGTDNIDKAKATEMGIVVMNTPGGNTISTCEHTFALMFALLRNVPQAHQSMAEGRWDRKKFMGSEVRGKTLGVIGVGRIGGEVIKRALAFEMKIVAFDPLMTQLKADALGIDLVSLEELYKRSDIITIHAPKSEKTNNMIRMEQLKMMKPTCCIINCARGGIVNEQDLAEALKNKIIAGAALDVYTSEPFENNPFLGLGNIVMTPHLAASTEEAQLTVAIDIAVQMADYLKTGAIVNAVNVPSLDAETRRKLQPLIFLAERLGRFQADYVQGRPSSIEIEYAGELGITDTYPVTAAMLVGFLAPSVENVNIVSAPGQLKALGIEYGEKRSATGSYYATELSLTVVTDEETSTVKGTLLPGTGPRICAIGGMRVDATPTGPMLVCSNEDVPQVLGKVCTVIGEAGINIANLTLGRDAKGGRAMTLLNLDQPVADEVLDAILAIPHVKEARRVQLPAE